MTRSRKRPERLTPAEWRVMRAIWNHKEEEVSVREICDDLEAEANEQGVGAAAYSTVKTLMTRLADKGHLSRRKRGNVLFYRPLTELDAESRSTVRELVDKVFGGVASPLVSYLTDTDSLSEADIRRLEEFVREQRRRRGRRPKR